MFHLIPENDPKQALRIRRFLMASGSYLMWMGLVGHCYFTGFFRLSLGQTLSCFFLASLMNLGIYIIFRSGFNKHFKDRSLTMIQMLLANLWVMFVAYFTDEARGVMLMLYMVVFVFGMFRLQLRQFILLAGIAIMSYVIVLLCLFLFHPDKININVEIMNLIVLGVVLPWCSILGSYINGLRLKLVKAKKRIGELANYDELTQIYNRHQMYRILERETALAQRGYPSFSICIFDLDHFKQVNDTFGHIAGDTVLKTLVAEIQKKLRDVDHIARFGGEEFVLILSYPDPDQSMVCAERIRKIARRVKYPGFPDGFGVTVSIGVTQYQPDESVEVTLSRADTALYRAKSKGRNRVEYEAIPMNADMACVPEYT